MDITALEEKRKRILKQIDDDAHENPQTKEYNEKLKELFSSKLVSRDNFVNWVTGLASGSLFLALSNLATTPQSIRGILLCSAIASFLGIAFAIIFKVLLEVRFFGLELEVFILKTLYDGHDLRTQMTTELNRTGVANEAAKQKFYKNMSDSLDLLDRSIVGDPSRSQHMKLQFLAFFFWASVVMFAAGITLIVMRYMLEYFSSCGVLS